MAQTMKEVAPKFIIDRWSNREARTLDDAHKVPECYEGKL